MAVFDQTVFDDAVFETDAGAGGTHPVTKITQLMPMAIPGRRYGSFAGKAGTGPTFQVAWARNANAMLGAGKIG